MIHFIVAVPKAHVWLGEPDSEGHEVRTAPPERLLNLLIKQKNLPFDLCKSRQAARNPSLPARLCRLLRCMPSSRAAAAQLPPCLATVRKMRFL